MVQVLEEVVRGVTKESHPADPADPALNGS
jgi:hypothetical protein